MTERTSKKETLADEAHRRLEEMFVTLKLEPGSRWSEDALVQLLGIGRTPVREGLQRMTTDNLISVRPNYGIVISKIESTSQVLVIEVRQELERLISRQATVRASRTGRDRLLALASSMQDVGSHEVLRYLELLFEINTVVAELSRNPFVRRAIAPLHALSRRFYYHHHEELDNLELVGMLHADRAIAVAGGKRDEAVAATDRLMAIIESFTLQIVLSAKA